MSYHVLGGIRTRAGTAPRQAAAGLGGWFSAISNTVQGAGHGVACYFGSASSCLEAPVKAEAAYNDWDGIWTAGEREDAKAAAAQQAALDAQAAADAAAAKVAAAAAAAEAAAHKARLAKVAQQARVLAEQQALVDKQAAERDALIAEGRGTAVQLQYRSLLEAEEQAATRRYVVIGAVTLTAMAALGLVLHARGTTS